MKQKGYPTLSAGIGFLLVLLPIRIFAFTGPCESLNPHAAQLVGLLNKATQHMTTGGKPDAAPVGGEHSDFESEVHCSQFFRQLMRELGAVGVTVPGEFTNENSNAEILAGNLQSSPVLWKKVASASQAQSLANNGAVVVGSSRGVPYYHLAVVQPVPSNINPANFAGSGGPFVRDGNEHSPDSNILHQFFPSTWGAVKASLVFDSRNPPTWYAFQPSIPSPWDNLAERARQELAGNCNDTASSHRSLPLPEPASSASDLLKYLYKTARSCWEESLPQIERWLQEAESNCTRGNSDERAMWCRAVPGYRESVLSRTNVCSNLTAAYMKELSRVKTR